MHLGPKVQETFLDEMARCVSELPNVHWLISIRDEPGVLSHIAGVLGENQIGIESVLQKGRGSESQSVPVLVMTHPAKEAAVRSALEKIDRLPDVTAPTRLIRIEEDL